MSEGKNFLHTQANESQHLTAEGSSSMMPPAFQLKVDQGKCSLCGGNCEGECTECQDKKDLGFKVLNALSSFGFEMPKEEETTIQAKMSPIQMHTTEECEEWKEECDEGCRRMPNRTTKDKALRQLCWAGCMAEYATCLASSEEALKGALTFGAIVAAIVLVAADGPFPIGDAAAATLLISLGILPKSFNLGL